MASVQPVEASKAMASFSSMNRASGSLPAVEEWKRSTWSPPAFFALDSESFIWTLRMPCGSSTSESGK